jgi:hypothetical protein
VVKANPDGKWRSHLSNNGRSVRKLLSSLADSSLGEFQWMVGKSGGLALRHATKVLFPASLLPLAEDLQDTGLAVSITAGDEAGGGHTRVPGGAHAPPQPPVLQLR